MRASRAILCIVGALVAHAGLMLFGGALFLGGDQTPSSRRDVELVTEDVDKDKPEDAAQDKEPQDLQPDKEAPPDASQVLQPDESAQQPSDEAPALEAASLSAIENALNGTGGGGSDGFGSSASLASGGVIGGTGRAGGKDEEFQEAFSMSQIDQRPRASYQVAPAYPASMRSSGLEGAVTVIFIVDDTGRVANPRVEKSSSPEFEAPALEAVRQWRFDPAVKAGKRVPCKMRVSIRFPRPR